MTVPKIDKPRRTCSTDGCGQGGKLTRGMCSRCYRYWLDHTPKGERPTAPRFVDDFWEQVEKTHEWGCWLWNGSTNHQGYGQWRKQLAHREAWRRVNGAIEGDLFILHICDRHGCVNPKHLYLGTREQNAIDAVARGRVHSPRKEYCPKGHLKAGDNLVVVQTREWLSYRCRQCENERNRRLSKEARHARGLLKTRMTPEEKARIWELCQGGMPQRKIAIEVGRSLSAVQQTITEARANGDR